MSTWLDIASLLVSVLVACTAVYAIYYARQQIRLARETSTREAYEHYHEILLQYPKFTTGNVEFETFDDEQFEQYQTFVLYTLMIGERVYLLFPNNSGWHYSIKDDIRLHKRFIGSDRFKDNLENQDWKTMRFIEEVLAEPNDA